MSENNLIEEIPFIADLHVHPTLKPMRQKPVKNIWEYIDMEQECKDGNLLKLFLTKEDQSSHKASLDTFSQSNFQDCLNNNVRLLGLAFYPPEANYFYIRKFAEGLAEQFGIEKKLARCISNFHPDISDHFLRVVDGKEDIPLPYFNDLEKEYQYTLVQSQTLQPGKTFKIASDFDDMEKGLQDSKTIVGFITIEGMHSLVNHESFKVLEKFKASKFNKTNSAEFVNYHQQYTQHIKKVKAWGEGKHSPLFISFTHHYWNFLCGHARSMQGFIAKFIIKQNFERDSDFTELGKQVARMLLDRSNGRRILIDIKHMSARSRAHFYNHIWKDFHDNNDPFPIICSHSAVNGIDTLVQAQAKKDSKRKLKGEYFNNWSINLCDEDIEFIFRSRGIIGMILHEGRLPGNLSQEVIKESKKEIKKCNKRIKKLKKKAEQNKEKIAEAVEAIEKANKKMREEYVNVFMANIFHIVRVCEQKLQKGKEAWDIICMGSDFDGLINAFDIYDHAEDLPSLAKDMLEFMESPNDIVAAGFTAVDFNQLRFGFSPQEIVKKIMSENMVKFLKTYFHDDYLKHGNLSS